MPVHYAEDVNIQKGTINLINQKEILIIFAKPFTKPPKVILSFIDSSVNSTPYLMSKTKSQFKVRFSSNVTVAMEWQATL
jgi:hypothetical protein